jgi:hypothetical protein
LLGPNVLPDFVHDILMTRPDEVGCVECFEQLDRYVDARLSGSNVSLMMPLVEAHLDHCPDCREESDALLTTVRSL